LKTDNSIFNKCTEILGEETDNYRPEFRGLYFSIKNIILREIEFSDKEIEISEFFDQETAPTPSLQQSINLRASKKKWSQRKGQTEESFQLASSQT